LTLAVNAIILGPCRLYTSFATFWPFYLREHSKASTRALHYVGTSLVVLIAIAAVVTGRWMGLVALPLAGYVFAWVAHYGVEKNRPATFTYPLCWDPNSTRRRWRGGVDCLARLPSRASKQAANRAASLPRKGKGAFVTDVTE
jgi:hypothetical protein